MVLLLVAVAKEEQLEYFAPGASQRGVHFKIKILTNRETTYINHKS